MIELDQKWLGKYMRLAKQVGEDTNPCYSRHIGVVIVDPRINKVVGSGYNGPPRKTPHTDERHYLENFFWPQLTNEEKSKAMSKIAGCEDPTNLDCEKFCDHFAGCKTCPRRLVDASSGKRLELCSCVHAETNAIVNSSQSLVDCYMICYCGVPCTECTKLIINAGIKRVYCFDWGADYSQGSRYLFEQAGVSVFVHPLEFYGLADAKPVRPPPIPVTKPKTWKQTINDFFQNWLGIL